MLPAGAADSKNSFELHSSTATVTAESAAVQKVLGCHWISFKQKASCSHIAHLLDLWNVNVCFEDPSFAMGNAPSRSERQMLEYAT